MNWLNINIKSLKVKVMVRADMVIGQKSLVEKCTFLVKAYQ